MATAFRLRHDARCHAPGTAFGVALPEPLGLRQAVDHWPIVGVAQADFVKRLEAIAQALNMQFVTPMGLGEVRHIAKSIGRWTWRRFSEEQFSKIQAARGRAAMAKRWAGHEAAEKSEPWKAEGVSRATWYRRRKNAQSNVAGKE